ncbi:PrsW family intramembrane metalloprotease [Candidatus Micrarchaeota archaeon]|nr:PrsW family intramembrane metalloprotease [Candidatus Micrarchaeota archaeon]
MLEILNRIFVFLVLLAVFLGIFIGLIVIFFPANDGFELEYAESMDRSSDFHLINNNIYVQPDDSPYLVNYTIITPPLQEFDQLYLDIYTNGRYVTSTDCLEQYEYYSDYRSQTEFVCTANIPYHYSTSQDYLVFATLYGEYYEFASGPATIKADWSEYENFFLNIAFVLFLLIGAVYLSILFPITLAIAYISSKTKRPTEQYTILSLLNPFANKQTLLQKFNSFLISPYFWFFEMLGIFLILIYMLLTAEVWKSAEALIAFFLSGLMAFMIPYLWCAVWWYADFREREPLRILITFFLWGMLAALMAIGINTVAGLIFEFLGVGFLGTLLVAPIIEEFYKGSGAALLSEHREFNSIEDGVVFGFVIGMGFSFIEDWIYLLDSPMGSDILSWFSLFTMRSILFSANHGFYTAITGGIIGFFIERGFKAPALGLLVGFPIAAVFHTIHNSGEMLTTLFGLGGLLTYCCLLIPLFDYGGLAFLLLLFIWALLRKKPTS